MTTTSEQESARRELRQLAVVVAVLVAPMLGWAAYWHFAPDSVIWRHELRAGKEATARIEAFRAKSGRLPQTLAEVGLPDGEEGPIYYRRDDERHYALWFGTSLGDSITYDSATQRWE